MIEWKTGKLAQYPADPAEALAPRYVSRLPRQMMKRRSSVLKSPNG